MQSGLLQADVENRGIVFDPKDKNVLASDHRDLRIGRSGWADGGLTTSGILCLAVCVVADGKKVESSDHLCDSVCCGIYHVFLFRTENFRDCQFPFACNLRNLVPISAKRDDGSLSCGNHYGE